MNVWSAGELLRSIRKAIIASLHKVADYYFQTVYIQYIGWYSHLILLRIQSYNQHQTDVYESDVIYTI